MESRDLRTIGNMASATLAGTLSAVLLALTPLLAPAQAQETTSEQTIARTQETTVQTEGTTTVKAEDTVAEREETTTGAAETGDDADTPNTSPNEPRQQTQADTDDEDDTPTATRAAGPLANEPAQITESTDDGDGTIANRIVIPDVDCEVGDGATVTVRDDDTQATLTDGGNVEIEQRQGRIVIVGTAEDQNLNGINVSGGEFGPSNGTENGTVVRSTGIACGRDGDAGTGQGNGGNTLTVDDGCDTLRIFEGDERVSETFNFPGASNRLRVVYSTLSEDGELEISVGEVLGRANGSNETEGFAETIEGAETGVISERFDPGNRRVAISLDPADQSYRVVLEAVGGDDECTSPRDVRGVLTESIPKGNLPNTGGVAPSVLAGCVALLLVGCSVLGVVVRRGR